MSLLLLLLPLLHTIPAEAFTLSLFSDLKGWETEELAFDVNYASCGFAEGEMNEIIDDALAAWNSVPTSGLRVVRGSSVSTTPASVASASSVATRAVIVCDPAFSTTFSSADPDVVAGIGRAVTFNHVIKAGGLVLNAQSGADASIVGVDPTLVTAIVIHEIGHVLGLGHSADDLAIMYYSLLRENTRLGQDDMDGISYLYPRQEIGGAGILGCASLARVRGGGGSGEGPGAPGIPAGALELATLLLVCALGAASAKPSTRALLTKRPAS